jgi:hypothetical protein
MVTRNQSSKRAGVWTLAGVAALAAAIPLIAVLACGPDFAPDVFVPASHPESAKVFALGSLGVLQPTYGRADKIVAYRFLAGGRLSEPEREAYAASGSVPDSRGWQEMEAAMPVNLWRVARAAVLKVDVKTTPEIRQEKSYESKRDRFSNNIDFLNCPDDAFVAAGAALRSRTKEWGAGSEDLLDWLKGQDAVFSNCAGPGTMPAAVRAGASTLLKLDRNYQVAAAKFYAGDYDGAAAAFETIGRSTSSPWQPWGEYLAARAEVRKAAMTATPAKDWGEQATFDSALLQKAAERLKTIAAVGQQHVAQAASAELQFIEVRLAPQKRLNDAAQALAGPKPDEEFAQDLADLLFLTGHNVTGEADLLRWIGQGGDVNAAAEWRARRTQPWLVAAMMQARGSDPGVGEMDAAAAKVPAGAPAYVTLNYQRARLMIERGDPAGARKLTTGVLESLDKNGGVSARNALLGERIRTANSYPEFLADASRSVVEMQSQSSYETSERDTLPKQQFDWDAATAFNRQLPLSRWMEAARAAELPEHLRRAVAMAAWLRAEGLGDEAAVKAAAALLPQSLRAPAAATDFPATLLLLRNPGIRPYLDQGVQRSANYRVLDGFRDNWWCQPWAEGDRQYDPASAKPIVTALPLSFLTGADKTSAADEAKRLNALPTGVIWVGRRAIDYVKAHPDEKDAAEALALVVRATRYGCYVGGDSDKPALEQKAISKEAFNLLHKQYPKSPWAAKTPYYY